MEWGYAWEAGPFKQMDLLGADVLRRGFVELGLDEPALLREATDGFYSTDGSAGAVARRRVPGGARRVGGDPSGDVPRAGEP